MTDQPVVTWECPDDEGSDDRCRVVTPFTITGAHAGSLKCEREELLFSDEWLFGEELLLFVQAFGRTLELEAAEKRFQT